MSHSLLDQLKASISPELLSDASKALNEPTEATEQAVGSALPALIAAIAAATRLPQGLSSVLRLVEEPVNDGTLRTQLASLYKGTMVAAPIYRLGSQLLQAVLGSRQTQLAQGIAALSGVRPASASTLLHILAPHLLDVIGTDRRAVVDKSPEGFARYMAHQKAHLSGALPAALADILNGPAAAASAVKATSAAAAVGVATAAAGAKAQAATAAPKAVTTATAAPSKAPAKSAPQAVVTAPKPRPSVPKKQTGIHDEDSRWGLVYLIAFFGIALFALAFGLLGQLDPNAPKPVASSGTVAPPSAPATVAQAPAAPKVADTKPAVVAPKPPAAVAPVSPAPAIKSAEAPQDAAKDAKGPASKPAKTADVPAPAAKDVGKEAAKKDAKPDAKPKVAAAGPAPIVVPPNKIAPAVPGVTHYYGAGKPTAESAAVANPDYKPAALAAAVPVEAPTPAEPAPAAPAAKVVPAVPGVTHFYGSTGSPVEAPAVVNPDYKPVVADAGPTIVVPPDTIAPAVPGVTHYFGSTASPVEAPAAVNPDYKPAAPAAPAVATAAAPPVAAAAVPAPAAPAATKAGDKAGTKMAAAIAAAAEGKAVTLPPSAKARVSTSPSKGVTTYFGPGPQVSPQSCAEAVATAVKSGTVLFRSGSADLTASSLPTLKRVARAFRGCQDMKLRIEGHTDDSGRTDMNQKLSEARAKSVVGYLTLRGADLARLSSAGFGMSKPLVPNSSAANKAQNRRIEFTVEKL